MSNEKDLFDIFNGRVKGSIHLIDISRDEEWDCTEFKKGIKKYFQFCFEGPGKVKCFTKGGDQDGILQNIQAIKGNFVPFHEKQAKREIPMEIDQL